MRRYFTSFTILLVLIISSVSCQKTFRIPNEALDYIPYEKGKILVFQSNTGLEDSLIITDIDHNISINEPLEVLPDKEETYIAYYKNTKRETTVNRIAALSSTEYNGLVFSFFYATKTACFYGENWFTVEDLEKREMHSLSVRGRTYEDVWIFEDTERQYEERDNFIERLYWSKSKGVIKYEKKNNEIWELVSR